VSAPRSTFVPRLFPEPRAILPVFSRQTCAQYYDTERLLRIIFFA
jgi:hypothetical protein